MEDDDSEGQYVILSAVASCDCNDRYCIGFFLGGGVECALPMLF